MELENGLLIFNGQRYPPRRVIFQMRVASRPGDPGHIGAYRVVSHDVEAVILVSQTTETVARAPCWCTKPILWEMKSLLVYI